MSPIGRGRAARRCCSTLDACRIESGAPRQPVTSTRRRSRICHDVAEGHSATTAAELTGTDLATPPRAIEEMPHGRQALLDG